MKTTSALRRLEAFGTKLVRTAKRVISLKVTQSDRGKKKTKSASSRRPSLDAFPNGNHYLNEQGRTSRREATSSTTKGKSVIDIELAAERFVPPYCDPPQRREYPPQDLAFVVVTNALYVRGVEGLLLSLIAVYPALESPIIVIHDGSLTEFGQSRLCSIYPNCSFREEHLTWFEDERKATHNHKRIGKLGFLNTIGLELRGFRHVVLLDSDLLVLGDISELWQSSEEIAVAYCFGAREYCAVSERTGRGIFNSGVISIPERFLTAESQDAMRAIMRDIDRPACPLLDRFADQKAWNLFLADKPVKVLSYNYNCNIKQLVQFHQGTLEGIRILHYVGPKPWISPDYVTSEEAKTEQLDSLTYHTPWRSTYRSLLYEKRIREYREELCATRRQSMLGPDAILPDTCVVLGNGASISRTNLRKLKGVEKFCFNWFLHHHEFDEIAPEHLVLGSHLFFGGWNTLAPFFPQEYLKLLRSKRHKPCLWAPFYFKPVFAREGLLEEFECNFVLFEKPFKRFVEKAGCGKTDLNGFLMDGRTAAISVAIPIACHLGFRRLVLVGCDSNYQQLTGDPDYFYPEQVRTTACNASSLLKATWAPDGPGQFAYGIIEKQLRKEGRVLLDATIGGHLTTVPKLNYTDLVDQVARVRSSLSGSDLEGDMASRGRNVGI